MVHLKGKDESIGRLLFIGGSKIALNNQTTDSKKYARQVGIIDLDKKSFTTHNMTNNNKENLSPVWGHTCLAGTYPKTDTTQTIFRFGGVNNFGLCYDKAYKSTDGIIWEEATFNSKNHKLQRVVPSAIFYNNIIWLAGGFNSFGDNSIIKSIMENSIEKNKDIGFAWKNTIETLNGDGILVENNQKGEIEKLFGANKNIKCFAIGKINEPSGINTGLVLIGINETGIFSRKVIDNNGYISISPENIFSENIKYNVPQTGAIHTAFVNGCLYFNIVNDGGEKGTTYSKYIYFHINVINSSTF